MKDIWVDLLYNIINDLNSVRNDYQICNNICKVFFYNIIYVTSYSISEFNEEEKNEVTS